MECFSSYLSNRKQFIEYDKRNIKTDFLDITCGDPHVRFDFRILCFLSFLCLKLASVYKHMTDDTNIFCSDRNIKNLFQKAKDELSEFNKISEWFRAKDKIHNFSQAID